MAEEDQHDRNFGFVPSGRLRTPAENALGDIWDCHNQLLLIYEKAGALDLLDDESLLRVVTLKRKSYSHAMELLEAWGIEKPDLTELRKMLGDKIRNEEEPKTPPE